MVAMQMLLPSNSACILLHNNMQTLNVWVILKVNQDSCVASQVILTG